MPEARVDILGPIGTATEDLRWRRVAFGSGEGEVTEEPLPNTLDADAPLPPPEAVAQADGEPPANPEPETPATHAEAAPKPAPPRRPKDPAVIRAFRAGNPIDGLVEKVIKGGYEVRVGKCRGFCPHSQMDVHRVENADEHVGKTYAFKILQLRRGGEDVVLSRREVLQAEHTD